MVVGKCAQDFIVNSMYLSTSILSATAKRLLHRKRERELRTDRDRQEDVSIRRRQPFVVDERPTKPLLNRLELAGEITLPLEPSFATRNHSSSSSALQQDPA